MTKRKVIKKAIESKDPLERYDGKTIIEAGRELTEMFNNMLAGKISEKELKSYLAIHRWKVSATRMALASYKDRVEPIPYIEYADLGEAIKESDPKPEVSKKIIIPSKGKAKLKSVK